MPGRVLERAVYIRSELLHFCGEFFSLVGLRLVGWSAGHRCGAAAGVPALSLRAAAGVQLALQGEQCAGSSATRDSLAYTLRQLPGLQLKRIDQRAEHVCCQYRPHTKSCQAF